MQKLKVINLALKEEITFDMSGNVLLSHIEGLGIPDVSAEKTQAVLQDGSDVHGLLLEDRIIRLQATIREKDRQRLYELRRKILRIINPKTYNSKTGNKGELLLFYTNDDKTYRIYAHVEDSVDFNSRFLNHMVVDIIFTANNPYLLDEENTKLAIKAFFGGLTFPLKLPDYFSNIGFQRTINNEGDTEVPLLIQFHGPVLNPIIYNDTTGESIKINRELEEGDTLEINTSYGNETVDIIKKDGSRENVFNWIDVEHRDFFKLIIGENIIRYSGDDESNIGTIDVEFSIMYGGV